jgi:uncharacterized protein
MDAEFGVEVAFSPAPREVDLVRVALAAGATVRDAVSASGLAARHAAVAAWLAAPHESELSVAVWGRRASAAQPLRERDRVELLRPLVVDPKEARRQRYRRTLSGNPTK